MLKSYEKQLEKDQKLMKEFQLRPPSRAYFSTDLAANNDLTEEEEMETGGDTAELSYLARVADAALGA